MPQRDVVVIGASAGGLEPLTTIMEGLRGAPPIAVLVVTHTPAANGSVLPQILARRAPWPVAVARDGERLEFGRIYVAQPDCHLLLRAEGLGVVHGPRENGFRPAIDPLFRTAARAYGSRVVGVLLSGGLDDGTYGLSEVKQRGGVAIVQHPDEAVVSSMPLSALRQVDVDHILFARDIAPLIAELARAPAQGGAAMAGSKEQEPQIPGVEVDIAEMEQDLGPPSGLTCPDCGGALWEVANGKMVRYKCHVGHQFSPDALVTEHSAAVESALWSAVRILEEHAELRLRLSRRAEAAGMRAVSHGFAERARESQEQAHHIRTVLFGTEAEVAPAGAEGVETSAEERVESRKRSPRGRAATAARGKTRRRPRGNGR